MVKMFAPRRDDVALVDEAVLGTLARDQVFGLDTGHRLLDHLIGQVLNQVHLAGLPD